MRRLLPLVLAVVLGSAACAPHGGAPALAPHGDSGAVATGATTVAANHTPTDLGRMVAHVPPHASTVGVVVLHSLGNTEAEPVRQGWSDAADRHGFVALYPYRSGSWNAGLCCGDASADGRDDVDWLATAIQDARQRYGLTTIYLAGFSNGGMMAERLVAERPDVSERLVAWGAAPEMPKQTRWSGTAVLYTGALDHTVPWTGGSPVLAGRPTLIRPSVTTFMWLPSAHLQAFVVEGAHHVPPVGWPELAWRALTAAPGLAPKP